MSWHRSSPSFISNELNEFIRTEFANKEDFTFWEKRTFKQFRVINLISKNEIFNHLFFVLQTVFRELTGKKAIPLNVTKFYFQYFVTENMFTTLGTRKFRPPRNWAQYLNKTTASQAELHKTLFNLPHIPWTLQPPKIADAEVQANSDLINDKLPILIGNLFTYLFAHFFVPEKPHNQPPARTSFELGYFLASYLLSNAALQVVLPWAKRRKMTVTTLQRNNALFYSKMYYAKKYIECLQCFFPSTFNYLIKAINKLIN